MKNKCFIDWKISFLGCKSSSLPSSVYLGILVPLTREEKKIPCLIHAKHDHIIFFGLLELQWIALWFALNGLDAAIIGSNALELGVSLCKLWCDFFFNE